MLPNLNDYVKVLLFGALVIFGAGTTRAADDLPRDAAVIVLMRTDPNVPNGACSGTVIAPGRVLSARHCDTGDAIRTPKGDFPVTERIAPTRNVDALIFVAPGVECPCIAPDLVLRLVEGDVVRAVGTPDGLPHDSSGRILAIINASEIFPDEEGVYIMASAQSRPGVSGGGLFIFRDGAWRLVGIVVASARNGQISGSVPVWEVPELF